ncbi:MAG: tRNA (adenosine(37)-N6)-threonylcarbamoyltransferase complex dimerization subunit type 1 TsaB [Gammaproteobacteria bacterium]|nr:tRNA (adenosine(37)-N6)-threonylcarbamoyltransferase complex dimerization subunit type 1 TsaB [Gammaproteobacteria bacterium]
MPVEPRRILALDTATENCSVALWLDGELRVRAQMSDRQHADLLLGMVDELLREVRVELTDLDCLAFGRGPGGFTGVRIATSVAQGLALGADLPVVPVSDLHALAWRAWQAHGWRRVMVAMDARMGELYALACELDGQGRITPLAEERVMPPGDLHLPPGVWCGAGPGWAAQADALAEVIGRLDGLDDRLYPDAAAVASLAALALADGTAGIDVAEARPVYLRDRVATPKRAKPVA